MTTKESVDDLSSYLGPNMFAMLQLEEPQDIQVITPWYRGGSETYVTDFLLGNDLEQKHLIAKACIKIGSREAMREWLTRRDVLQENGVNLPELIAVDGATIVEEYIPQGFAEAYCGSDLDQKADLKLAFVDTYKRIVGAGFSPASLHDIRSRGADAVVIDFGEDLGPPSPITSSNLSVVLDAEKHFRNIIR